MFGKTKEEKGKKVSKEPEREYTFEEFAAAEEELKALKKEHGIEEKQGRISRAVSSMFERAANREPIPINKKKYITLALLTGWFGGHRFYAKHYKVGLIYLSLFWLGIGLYHSMLDIFQVIPMQADENGMILL